MQWFGNARADNLADPAFVQRLRQAGCWMLALGIETESEETRKDMMKRLEGQKIRTALANMRAAGIRSFGFFILGYPGETPQSLERTIDYAIELDPDFANFYPAVPYPGTELYAKAKRDGLLVSEDWTRMEYSYYLLRGQRPRRADRHGRDQPRQAPLLPAARLPRAPRRRRRPAGVDEVERRLARRLARALRRAGRPTRPAVSRAGAISAPPERSRSTSADASAAGSWRARPRPDPTSAARYRSRSCTR